MIDHSVYQAIQRCRLDHRSKRATGIELGIHENTVSKYWNMTEEDFLELSGMLQKNSLESYRELIVETLKNDPGVSAETITKMLQEQYAVSFTSRTVSRYVKQLREEYELPRRILAPKVFADNKYRCNVKQKADGLDLLLHIKDATIATCFFDPQYRGILDAMQYGNEGIKQSERIALQQMDEKTIIQFIKHIERVLKPSGYLMLWVDKFELFEGVHSWIQDTSLHQVDMIVWDKKTFGMGFRSRRVSEYLVVLQKAPIRARDTWTDHGIPDVWREKAGKTHPHAKPVELQKRLVESTTKKGDYVVDPCAGSYSVMKACLSAGRHFVGCDIM